MPQRVVVFYSCSLCSEESQDASFITELKITYGKTQLELEVCEICAKAEPLSTLLMHGRKPVGQKPSPVKATPKPLVIGNPSDVKCEYCDEWFSPKGIGLHLSKTHNVKSKTADMTETRGKGPHKCPDCDYGAKAPPGLAAHRRHAHGYRASK